VDIAQNFLDHIKKRSTDAGLKNVETLQCPPDSTGLKPASIDAAFICDVYHHFEFPQKTMTSLFAAMKPAGRLMLIDFKRVEGKSTDFVMKHVRAGQEVFEAEIARTGFRKVKEVSGILAENYFLIFEKPAAN
jgi:ubiquinone/menaquinone biosynthesis C-methylase UbiE